MIPVESPTPDMRRRNHKSPSPMFVKYIAELVVRFALFAFAIFFLFTDPRQLDISAAFDISHGITFVDIAFVLLILDMATKLLPSAKIAIGSKKQYKTFHKPTPDTVSSEIRSHIDYLRSIASDKNVRDEAAANLSHLPHELSQSIAAAFAEHVSTPAKESVKGFQQLCRQIARQLSIMTGRQIDKTNPELLHADEAMRSSIRRRRVREIVPVIVFWVLFNALIACILYMNGLLIPTICLVWCLFYFVSDMICVVAWCPFQVLLMRNRCCTTCQIFNWDAIMAVTPLLFAPCAFSFVLIALALVILARWEVAFLRNPERFDERTNAALSCANCTDKLCYLRRPLKESRIDDTISTSVSENENSR